MRAVATRRLFLALGLAVGLTGLAACDRGGGGTGAAAPVEGDMTLGRADAPVTLVEYASATCSHCANFHEQVFPAFKARYVDTGRVRYVFREFLTAPEPVAAQAFMVARCAGRDRYFAVLDAFFRAQPEMFRTQDWRGTLLRIAQSAGMSEEQFTACIRDEAALNRINDRQERAVREQGVTGTPTFFVNGRNIATGEVTLAQLSAAIDPLLGANAPAPAASGATPAAPAATANPVPAGAASPAAPAAAGGPVSATETPAVIPTPTGPATATTAAAPAAPAR